MKEERFILTINNYRNIGNVTMEIMPGPHGFVGDNEQGKTNLLGVFEELRKGGNDVLKIKEGENRATIGLVHVLDGEVVAEIERTQSVSKSGKPSNVLKGDVPDNLTPAAYVDTLIDEIAVSPMRIMSDNPVKWLQANLSVDIGPNDLPSDLPEGLAPGNWKELNAFEIARRCGAKVSEKRLNCGRDLKAETAVAQEMKDVLGYNEPENPDIAPLESRVDEIKGRLASSSTINDVAEEFAHKASEAEAKRDYLSDEVVRLEEELKVAETALAQHHKMLEAAQKDCKRHQPVDVGESKAELEAAQQALAEAQEAIRLRGKWAEWRERDADVKALQAEYDLLDKLTKYFERELPAKLLERCELGVPGISIEGGEIILDGRPLQNHSEARQNLTCTRLALAVAKMKGKRFVCLDGVEVMDKEHRAEFLKAIEDSGLFGFYTRVGKPEEPCEREVRGGALVEATA